MNATTLQPLNANFVPLEPRFTSPQRCAIPVFLPHVRLLYLSGCFTLFFASASAGGGAPPPALYPLRARTMCSRSRARISNGLQPARDDASNASMYWCRISPTI
jgi:hypothetical protein